MNPDFRLSRTFFDRLLTIVQNRIIEYNSDPDSVFRIDEAYVFGDYADFPLLDRLDNVDIAIRFSRIHPMGSKEYLKAEAKVRE